MNSDDEEDEEEVRFLLRLRPTPSPPVSRRRKSSVGSSRPVSGSGWGVVIERQGGTPQPQRRTSWGSRPPSGTSWDTTSQPSVAPSAPHPVEVHSSWVCPTPQSAWSSERGPLFQNVNWTQPFAATSQLGFDYRHLGLPTSIPQTLPLQEDYRHDFETRNMFFHPLSVDTTSFQLPNNLPLHPQPQKPAYDYLRHPDVSKDLSLRQNLNEFGINGATSLLHKKSYSADETPRESQSNLASLKSISLSHGNLSAAKNQNILSGDYYSFNNQEFISVNKGIQSSAPEEADRHEHMSADSENNRFVNSFRRYSLTPPDSFGRSLSVDRLQPCGVSEEPENVVDAKPPAVPPRPPKPTRLCSHERRRSQQETTNWQPPVNFDVEERLRRLEADKDSLQLQVTVLTEQIEVQTDKISDLEKLLEEKKMQLANAEDVLQREMLSRSSSETQKLELLSAMSELKLHQAALERDNLELRDRLGEERRRNKPPVIPRSALLATSTPVSSQQASQLLGGGSPSPSPVSSLSEGSPRRLGNHPNSVEDFKDIPAPRTPPANYRRKVEHYGSLPRQRITTNGTAVSPLDGITPTANSAGMRKGVAFGKGLVSSFLPFQHPHHHASRLKVSGPDKSFSTPNLAETERVVIDDVPASPSAEVLAEEEVDETTGSLGLSPQPSPSFQSNRGKGIKKIFGRVKRSGSGNLDDVPGEGEFRRGGVRATAGPRLGWTNQPFIKQKSGECCRPDQPFAEWDSEAISGWLQELGLDCYAGDTKRWVKSGAQLLQASNHELEKELGIKNPIHRKKLHLALLSQQEAVLTLDPYLIPAGELDTAWVLRWLDDAGLPQHKETFLAARVDGRVLHRLTMDELAILHVTSHLHIASLRRGIQVLRNNKFEPNCLKRRSLPDDPSQPTAQDVALWTNHRVMEWLRIVDLAEYAPNLRGSGVHGGLMVHEPRFTAELMASLLSIPPSKTLLRRHLNTHFKELLGRDCIQEKREAEATLGYVPLSATTKVKVTKKSQFILKRKKSRSELDFGDLVCPLDPNKSGETLPPGDGMTQTEARHPRAVAACREAAISSPVDRLISECKFPERTSDV
ncbi:liprin-beta-1 isoform X16 [Zootermopsis nevadensis]|uniref:liprin-beta-1 isoform X16 n=1 Tax=Zootermopsis nevadensis TaxID=136037 RepID=UPI000B8E4DE8|nr:liprin-beta-1 isoform X16 [Zootermopsis nevadensis]